MIDLELLDQQLEHALTHDVRVLRSVRTSPPARPLRGEPEPQPEAKKLSTEDWDWDDADWPEPEPAPETPVVTPVAAWPVEARQVAPRPQAPPPPAPAPEPPTVTFRPRRTSRRQADQRPLHDSGPVRRHDGRTPLERLREAAATMESGGPRPERRLSDLASRIPELLAQGLLAEADDEIANHAALLARRGIGEDRVDAAAWATMRALLDGLRDEAVEGLATVDWLGREVRDVDAGERYWMQRFWIALEWGDDAERYEVLDHCRERAYRYDDVVWRAALSLQHARMGREDEAAREFDAAAAVLSALPADATRLDVVTNLAETAFLLADAQGAATLVKAFPKGRSSGLVVVGPGWVCKGSLDRFSAHLAAAAGRWNDADPRFAAAVATHRNLGAHPLLARTLREWGSTLVGRDDVLARRHLDESEQLARRLQLTGLPVGSLALNR